MKNEGGSRRPGRGSRSPAHEREEGALEGPGVGAAGVKRRATAFESRQSLTRVCTGHNLIGFLQETERQRERGTITVNADGVFSSCWPLGFFAISYTVQFV